MRQIITLLFMATLFFSNTVFAIHMFKFDNTFQVPISVIKQFDGIVINGITAETAYREAYNSAVDEANNAAAKVTDEYNNGILEKYNNMAILNEKMSNITARTSYFTHSSPYDFINVGGAYIHWLSYDDREETCKHYSYEEMEKHASVFTEMNKLWYMLVKEKRTLRERGDSASISVMSNAVSKALAPYVDIKLKEYTQKAEDYNNRMKDYNCRARVTPYPQLQGIVKYCKDFHRCYFRAGFDQNDIIGIHCDCGHLLYEHKYKLKNDK